MLEKLPDLRDTGFMPTFQMRKPKLRDLQKLARVTELEGEVGRAETRGPRNSSATSLLTPGLLTRGRQLAMGRGSKWLPHHQASRTRPQCISLAPDHLLQPGRLRCVGGGDVSQTRGLLLVLACCGVCVAREGVSSCLCGRPCTRCVLTVWVWVLLCLSESV